MSTRSAAAVAAALKVADHLDEIGEHKFANDVRRVCKSNSTYRGTLEILHRDNMAIRLELGR